LHVKSNPAAGLNLYLNQSIHIMRTLIYLVVLILVGALAGIGLAILDYEGLPRDGAALADVRWTAVRRSAPDPNAKVPRAEVVSTEFDFGTMERDSKKSHEFAITNTGQAPLELSLGATSCSCTISGLESSVVPPGESVNVKLEWTASQPGEWFRNGAKILTNDADMPEIEFIVRGQIVETVQAEPQQVTISKPLDESASKTVNVVSRITPDLQITGYEVDDASTAEQFAVEYESVTPTEPNAKSQWSVKVTVKPGLPIGSFQQKIRLLTNLTEKPKVPILVGGVVYSDIQVLGTRWETARGVLHLGTVDPQTGMTAELKVSARGPDRESVKLTVKSKVPDSLEVVLGEPESLAGGAVRQIPVTIKVPPGLPPTSYLGSADQKFAEIVLETGYPAQPELTLKVSFAVGR
jgi:hypothetical protein